jgi:hypothetical protein
MGHPLVDENAIVRLAPVWEKGRKNEGAHWLITHPGNSWPTSQT